MSALAVAKLHEQGVRAVLVTGDTAPAQVQRIHESGHIVLFKPVPPKELFNVLYGTMPMWHSEKS